MALLIDSSVWIALFADDDVHHSRAKKLFQTVSDTVYVPYGVIVEVATVLTYKYAHAHACAFFAYITQNRQIVIVGNDVLTEMVFFQELAKRISFTDAALLHSAKVLSAELITFDMQLARLAKKSRAHRV